MAYYVYILECSNGSFYTGYTTDLERRYKEHQQGTAKCKYTRSFPPKKITAYWELDSLSEALKLEIHIKSLTKKQKFSFIKKEFKRGKRGQSWHLGIFKND